MEFVIISGMSGAGKTSALHIMEDIGYYCVDNIPTSLLQTLYKLCKDSSDRAMKRVAVVVDVRGNGDYEVMYDDLENFKKNNEGVSILYIDAKVDSLIVRYKETRRRHPLTERLKDGSVAAAVKEEQRLLVPVKTLADYSIDTTFMSIKQLRERIISMFLENSSNSIMLTFMSFGFKYGIPLESDLIIDVRCLPNPFYIAELKEHTGLEKCIQDYVLDSEETQEFVKRLIDWLDYSLPLYLKEGKSELVVGIGCTGGKHRSVTIAELLDNYFMEKGYKCIVQHRDVKK
ncbi:RNase adapter RapZ [Ruminococcus sp.]|uniref:RNase adapter RapZ n=1 Tax=Ruminococcus TaxID=1263 RepID=UPI0025D597D1|nr:RNase adapter RapZ [Ruminococcus sp.]MBD9050521.1 RNase adapter RapZ [Ruminococcus sp.]